MEKLGIFRIAAGILVTLFLVYGMDVRRKKGIRHFVTTAWQALMKLCAFAMIGAFVWFTLAAAAISGIDWVALAVMAAGTAWVVAAKQALGNAHTFTGQCLAEPRLVTDGIFALTRNPLYLGVFLCEAGAALFVSHQAPSLLPQSYPYWLTVLAITLAYTIGFNWRMALHEARHLEDCFGDAYREYQGRVPFLLPVPSWNKEIK